MNRLTYLLIAATAVLIIEGCSTFTVRSQQTPKTDDTYTVTKVSYLWGLSDPVFSADCGGRGFEFVSSNTNLLYGICSVVTLGIVTPMQVTYRCTGVQLQEGTPFGK